MFRSVWGVIGLVLLSAAFALHNLHAQYRIDGWTVDGGGAKSTGGVYRVTGTAGQPDAGVMQGGALALHGGFWGMPGVVQTPGAPPLSAISASGNTVMIVWPGPEAGWRLESTTNLCTTPIIWTFVPPPYQTNGDNFVFIDDTPVPIRFYRLQQP